MHTIQSLVYQPAGVAWAASADLSAATDTAWRVVLSGSDTSGEHRVARHVIVDNLTFGGLVTVKSGARVIRVAPYSRQSLALDLLYGFVDIIITTGSPSFIFATADLGIPDTVNEFGSQIAGAAQSGGNLFTVSQFMPAAVGPIAPASGVYSPPRTYAGAGTWNSITVDIPFMAINDGFNARGNGSLIVYEFDGVTYTPLAPGLWEGSLDIETGSITYSGGVSASGIASAAGSVAIGVAGNALLLAGSGLPITLTAERI